MVDGGVPYNLDFIPEEKRVNFFQKHRFIYHNLF